MMARLVDSSATTYAEPDRASPVVADVSPGEALHITGRVARDGAEWVAVTLPDERHGYVPSETKLASVPRVELDGDATIHAAPVQTAPVLAACGAGARLWVLDTVTQDGSAWLKVADADGRTGFMPQGAPLLGLSQGSAKDAAFKRGKHNMAVGGLWCAGGTAVTVITHMMASGGGTYVVAWGAIVFGGWQLLRGVAQYLGAGD